MESQKSLYRCAEIFRIHDLFCGAAIAAGGQLALLGGIFELVGACGLQRRDTRRRGPNTA